MKYIYIILTCFALCFGACKNNGASSDKNSQDSAAKVLDSMKLDSINPGIKRFEIEKGVMSMKSFFSNQLLLDRTIYFDRYGARLVIMDERKTSIYEMNGFKYILHENEKKVVKERLTLESNYDPQMLNALLMTDTVKKEISWTPDGEEEILGRKCQKYLCHHNFLHLSTEVWLYKGFPVRVHTTDPQKNVSITECKKIDENITIDPSRFELPSWVKK
ncbi:MAG: hypothetical protein SGJ10_03135 [Bacteroidota bacterium]|nr:hypothetical protein [Bacteroidota bacterium]